MGRNPTYQLPVGHCAQSTHEPGVPERILAVQAAPLCFFWNGMSHDCLAVAAVSLMAQKKWARFRRPWWLYLTKKSAQLFRYYVLNCLVQLSPAAPKRGTAVVIAIDLFTKWLEYMILPHLDSYYVT